MLVKIVEIILTAIIICSVLILIAIATKDIKQDRKINIEEYPVSVDYGILSLEQSNTFESIINAAKDGVNTVKCTPFSIKEKHEILTQLGLYYGSTENLNSLVKWNEEEIILNLELFQELMERKTIIDSRIDEAVSTLYECSDRCKLRQISDYISAKIRYTDGYRDIIGALNGKGVCSTYSMLFYKMATRIGIQTYICYGYAGSYHSWNMVVLNDERIFYDVTWYDADIYDFRFIHSDNSWGRIFQINNRWSTDLHDKSVRSMDRYEFRQSDRIWKRTQKTIYRS